MDCVSTATSAAAAITDLHPDIIRSHVLNRLDGPALASAACSSAELLSLCAEDGLWRGICNSTWPSTADPAVRDVIAAFPYGHRSFYSDAFPAVRCHGQSHGTNKSARRSRAIGTSELISAVDIYCDDELLYSKVLVTDTRSSWFMASPLRLDLLEPKETVPTPLALDGACAGERLRVSWVVIDPSRKRAVNVASLKAVEARRHWLTEGIQLRYATVVGDGAGEAVQLAVVVNCWGEEGGEVQLREVSMAVEDMDGVSLAGEDSLVILGEAMEGRRFKSCPAWEKDVYDEFQRRRMELRETRQKRERNLDMLCAAIGVSVFLLAVWITFLRR